MIHENWHVFYCPTPPHFTAFPGLCGAHFGLMQVLRFIVDVVVHHAKLSAESEVDMELLFDMPHAAAFAAMRGTLRFNAIIEIYRRRGGSPREALRRERSVVEMPGIEPGSNV